MSKLSRADILTMFGYKAGTKLYNLLYSSCANFCCIVKNCLGISSSGNPNLVLNQQGDWLDVINGTNFLRVAATENNVNNGNNFLTLYNLAKTLTPNGLPLSSTNRLTLIVDPGYYSFSTMLNIDAQYIDIVSKTGNTDLFFEFTSPNTIYVTANDVYLRGINVGTTSFRIATNLALLKCEKCKGGNVSFNSLIETVVASGTFIDCEGGNNSFGTWNGVMAFPVNGSTTGTFIRCKGGAESFGSRNSCGGLFIDCEGTSQNAFGRGSVITGTFIRCRAFGNFSFGQGTGSTSTGFYYYCIGGVNNFSSATNNGFYYHCVSGSSSFTGLSGASTGKALYCVNNNNPFNYGFTATNMI